MSNSSPLSKVLIPLTLVVFIALLLWPRDEDGGTESAPAEQVVVDDDVDFSVAPLPEIGQLDTKVELETLDGKRVKLGEELATRGLVVYIDADWRDRQNRAATRMIEPLLESGQSLGFKIIYVFDEEHTVGDLRRWQQERRMEEATCLRDVDGEFVQATGWSHRNAALVDSSGRIGLKFERSERWDSRTGFEPALTSDILSLVWKMPEGGPVVDQGTMDAAVAAVRESLASLAAGGSPDVKIEGPLSKKLKHPAYVTLFRPGTTERLRGGAQPTSLGKAMAVATEAAIGKAKDGSTWLKDAAAIRIQIDLTGPLQMLPTTDEKALWYLLEPGVHGIVLAEGDRRFVMLPAEPVTEGWLSPRVRTRDSKHEKIFRSLSRKMKSKGNWRDGEAVIERFRSTTFGTVVEGGPATRFFRGNVLGKKALSEEDILRSIRIGGQWLVNTVEEDGKFDYEYFPSRDEHSTGYNIVRHAGSVYGLFEMYELAGHEPALAGDRDLYIEAAARAMSYVYEALDTPRDGLAGRLCLLDARGGCDSGSAALTLLTFLVRPDKKDVPAKLHKAIYRKDDDKIMEGLGLALLDMIDERGAVFRRYSQSQRMKMVKKEPLYYPGETMLALMRFYEATKDERWLAGAKAIADRQVELYKKKRFRVPDHWVMQAYLPLWQVTKDEAYVESAYAMATHYTSELYDFVWSPWPDYDGAWRRVDYLPRTTRAGSRSEALRAVVNLGWLRGDDMTVHEDALLAAARHLDEQQFSERNSYWLPNPEEAYGAYPMGLVDNHCRIDNNQHALVGMVGALHVARRRAGK